MAKQNMNNKKGAPKKKQLKSNFPNKKEENAIMSSGDQTRVLKLAKQASSSPIPYS